VPASRIRPAIRVQLLLAAEPPAIALANFRRLRVGLSVVAAAEAGPRPHVAVPSLGPVGPVLVGAAAHFVAIVEGREDFCFEAPGGVPPADRPHVVRGIVLID